MPVRFVATRALPSLLLYAALLALAVAADWLLHLARLAAVGRWLGLGGTLLILLSFAYSLRKRRLILSGSPGALLAGHEVLGWVGALAVLVHGGVHFNALIPWLAVAAMLVVVASGFTGKYLLRDAREGLREQEAALRAKGLGPADVERELLGHSLLVDTMQRWRSVHMPLTMVFAALATLHVAATLFFWGWR